MHGVLSTEMKRTTAWLEAGSSAVKAVEKVVLDKNLLKALDLLAQFCHTGEIEVFHSLILKYYPKRQHFPCATMKARTLLAALHWNFRQRDVATTAEGADVIDVVWSKRRKSWVMRQRYKVKTPGQISPIMKVMEIFTRKIRLPPLLVPDSVPNHVSQQAEPSVVELREKHSSQFAVDY